MNVAIQSYNYGGGYVGYVAGKGKKHTFNLAESFAREKSGGKKVTYTNPIAVAKNGERASKDLANNLNLAMVTIYTFLLFFCCFGCYKGEKLIVSGFSPATGSATG